MKKILLLCAVFLGAEFVSPVETYACIGSKCTPCPDGFSVTGKCCNGSNGNDCVFLGKEIEDCGSGEWGEYPHSLPFASKECCKDPTENNCRFTPYKQYCGTGEFREYPYSPVKKCCKDPDGNDCVTIRSKRQCGKYQLEQYPVRKGDCCNPDLTKCTGYVADCPKCI